MLWNRATYGNLVCGLTMFDPIRLFLGLETR